MIVQHHITHHYQPTNHTCCQSSMAILLSFFNQQITPQDIINIIPISKNDKGEDWGTITQNIATWCLSKGFDVDIYTADFQIIDLSWANLSKDKLVNRMEIAKAKHNPPSHSEHSAKMYMQSYIDFVKAGGNLKILPYISIKLLNSLLEKSPLLVNVSFGVLYNIGRCTYPALRKIEPNDIDGKVFNHSIVIYGKTANGKYMIADPWTAPGLHEIEEERLLSSMAASQVEWDNMIVQLKLNSENTKTYDE